MPEKDKRVYIVNKSPHDFSPAEKFGKLVFLTEGVINPLSVSLMYRKISKRLESSSKEDYLLVTSHTHINIVAATIFAVKHKRLNLLLYNGERYVPRTIEFNQQ